MMQQQIMQQQLIQQQELMKQMAWQRCQIDKQLK